MKRLFLLLAIILFSVSAHGQDSFNPVRHGTGAPSGTCSTGRVYNRDSNGHIYGCSSGTWTDNFSSATPGGSDTQVQFNDSGSFGGDAGFTYNKTTDTATLGTLSLTNPLTVANGGSGAATLTGLLKGNGTSAFSAATAGTDYVTGSSTNTFTNKTFDTAGTGNAFSINGVAATANTGTGAVARATSPTFVSPVLGAATGTSLTVGGSGQAITSSVGSIISAGGFQVGNGSQVTLSNGTNFSAGIGRSSTGADHMKSTNGSTGALPFEASGFAQAINTSAKTGTYSVTDADGTIVCSSTGGTFVENLPAANAVAPGRIFIFLNIGSANQCTITRAGSDTITDGSTTGGTTYALTNASRVALQSDGVSVWYRIN